MDTNFLQRGHQMFATKNNKKTQFRALTRGLQWFKTWGQFLKILPQAYFIEHINIFKYDIFPISHFYF